MDRHAEQAVKGGARRGFSLAALLLALASGCVSSGQVTSDLVTTNQVSQVVGVWNNQVLIGVDPAHNGAPMYGLAGRIFLYSAGMDRNLYSDGNMVIEMWGTPPEQPQSPPVRLESWEIKKDILNSACLRKDGFGEGYTLNLPWPSYRPDLSQLQMRVRYEPPKGLPVYGESTVVLNRGANPELTASHRMEGPNHQPITTAPPPAPAPQVGAMPPPPVPPPVLGMAPQGPPVPQPGAVQSAMYQAPMQQPGAVQPAIYPAPMQQPGQAPTPPSPPAAGPTPQPFPGAYQH